MAGESATATATAKPVIFISYSHKDEPERPGEAEIAKLREEAAEQIKIAAGYIASCGYHRRDEELAEPQAVLRNEKTFAELPPRV